ASTAPRACPTESAMRASAPTNDSSSATASGACSAMSASTASWIVFKRRTVSCPAGVDQQPCATSLRRPPLSWTIPYPQAAVPGSMPTTFTRESYGPDRPNPVAGEGPRPRASAPYPCSLASVLDPPGGGQLGGQTDLDPTPPPPVVRHVDYVVDLPTEEDLIQSFPVFLVSDDLGGALAAANLT